MSTLKTFTLLVITSLFCGCQDKGDDPTHKNPFSFYPLQGAEWYFHDSFWYDYGPHKDDVRFLKFNDTFTLGNLVSKQSRLISKVAFQQDSDTAEVQTREYFEINGKSRRQIRLSDIAANLSDSLTTGFSGYIRFDIDSLKVYSLKYDKNEDEYYEYLMNSFVKENKGYVYRPTTVMVETVKIKDIDFLKATYSGNAVAYAGISLENFSYIWTDGMPIAPFFKRNVGDKKLAYQLHYGNQIYP